MAQYTVTTHLLDPIYTLLAGDLLEVLESGYLEQNLENPAVVSMDSAMRPVGIYLAGRILGSETHAAIYSASQAFEMEIAETGILTGRSAAIEISTPSWARITNNGLITTDQAYEIDDHAHAIKFVENTDIGQYGFSTFRVVNTGTITTCDTAIAMASNQTQNRTLLIENTGIIRGDFAIHMERSDEFGPVASDRLKLVNDGAIEGLIWTNTLNGSDYLSNTGTIDGYIRLGDGDDVLINSGTLNGDYIEMGDGEYDSDGDGEGDSDGDDVIINTGTINSGIELGYGDNRITNSGTINGRIDMFSGNTQINNSGTINGHVSGFDGHFRFVNSGIVNGFVFLGHHDSVYRAIGSGTVTRGVNGQSGNDRLYGADGNDILAGRDGNDVLFGGAGNDTLFADVGADWIVGGAGFDYLSFESSRSNQTVDLLDPSRNYGKTEGDTIQGIEGILGGGENDRVFGTARAEYMFGDFGNDRLYGRGGKDTLDGGTGNDRLDGGDGNDLLHGHHDDDLLYGRNGNDMMRGGTGNDTLMGGQGNDTLFGGAGTDRFLFGAYVGRDVVQDLESGEIVEISGLAGHSAAQVIDLYGEMTADGVRLTFAPGHSILFRGADMDLVESTLLLV